MVTQANQSNTATNGQGLVVLAGDGKAYEALGTTTVLKARAEETGGLYEVIESTFPPSGGIPPHLHQRINEAVCVLAGELVIQVGERSTTAGAGSFVFVPRGTVHAFQNASGAPATLLIWMTPPPGMEAMLEEMNQVAPDPANMGAFLQILRKYDNEFLPPPGH